MDRPDSVAVNWKWIGDAWRLFTSNVFTWILMQLTVVLFILITISPAVFLAGGFGFLLSKEDWSSLAGLSVVGVIVVPILLIVLVLGGIFLLAGLSRAAIKKAQGGEISYSDLFSGSDVLLPLTGFYLLYVTASIAAGIVPRFIFGVSDVITSLIESTVRLALFGWTFFSVPLIVDRRAGVVEAIEESLRLTLPKWSSYILLALVIQILSSLGFILLFIGIFVTLHFQWTVSAVAYTEVYGLSVRSAAHLAAPPPPPQYWPEIKPDSVPTDTTLPDQPEDQTLPLACPSCGSRPVRVSRFCSQCGASLAE